MTDYPYYILPLLDTSGGRILELGARHYSTPFVQYLTLARACTAHTYDADPHALDQFRVYYESDAHHFTVCNWIEIPLQRYWDLVIVNHDIPTDMVRQLLTRVAWWAKYVFVSGYSDAFSEYCHRLDAHIIDSRMHILSNLRVIGS